jgi:hypothetical protein
MRKLLLTAAASAAMLEALFVSSGAEAMTPASASGIRAAAAATDLSESVVVVADGHVSDAGRSAISKGPLSIRMRIPTVIRVTITVLQSESTDRVSGLESE